MKRFFPLGILLTLLLAMMILGCGEQENVMAPQSIELEPITLAAPRGPAPEGCMNFSLAPSSISTPPPQAFKFYQISGRLSIGDCGMVLCSTVGLESNWESAPGTGIIEIGPFPPGSMGKQICQGGHLDFQQFLIVTRNAPRGTYKLRFTAKGFGGSISHYLMVTIE